MASARNCNPNQPGAEGDFFHRDLTTVITNAEVLQNIELVKPLGTSTMKRNDAHSNWANVR